MPSASVRVSSRADRRRMQPSVCSSFSLPHMLGNLASDSGFFFSFRGFGGGRWVGPETKLILASVASRSSGMMVLSGAWCTIPVLGCLLVVTLCTSLRSATFHFFGEFSKILSLSVFSVFPFRYFQYYLMGNHFSTF